MREKPIIHEALIPESMKIAFLQNSFAGGGAEKTALILAKELARRGHDTLMIANKAEGALLPEIPSTVRTRQLTGRWVQSSRLTPLRADPFGLRELRLPVILGNPPPRSIRFIHSLRRLLRHERPDFLISMTPFITLQAIWARRLARVPTKTLNVEQIHLSRWLEGRKGRRYVHLLPLLARCYREVDVLVAASDGVADNLSDLTGMPRSAITTIHNPAVTPELETMAQETIDHPWFRERKSPVILTAGRLDDQKDHPTLIKAFAKVRARRPVHLVILGDAQSDKNTAVRMNTLRELASSLGVSDDVYLAGFQHNPFRYMNRAAVFVLTSRYEGLGNVLIEALACGCPIVSTDCESGPSEILEHGRYGTLVPVGDVDAIADAILSTLDDTHHPEALKARARDFSVDRVTTQYEQVMRSHSG